MDNTAVFQHSQEPLNPLDVCTSQWKSVFMEGPYTSFTMVRTLMEVLGIMDPGDLLRNKEILVNSHRFPEFAPSVFEPDWVVKAGIDDDSPYHGVWAGRAGRCTSFAIKIARRLERDHPGQFQFSYYDLRGHRVARCNLTCVVIDSASKKGAEVLPVNAEFIDVTNASRGSWKNYNGESYYQRNGHRETLRAISCEEALGICLREVARNAVLVCLFRSIVGISTAPGWQPEYHGMIRWNLGKKRIELVPNLADKKQFSSIQFGTPGANEASHKECVCNMVAFIKACGFEHQWKADGVDQFHQELWASAVDVWGYPAWKTGLEL